MVDVTSSQGVFISHAHKDQDLAQALRRLLEFALGLGPQHITCTSDAGYDLAEDADLRDQIHKRLQGARALLLLATDASHGSSWVQYECAYAAQAVGRGDMHFYVLVAADADRPAVPEPYRDRVAVVLSDGAKLHTFLKRLRTTFGQPSGPAADYLDSLLHVQGLAAKRREAERTHELSRLESAAALVKRQRARQRQAAWVIAAAWAATSVIGFRYMSGLEAEHRAAIVVLTAQMQKDQLAAEDKRDEELKSFPLSGVFRDGSGRVVKCSSVEARLRQSSETRMADCDGGESFTFFGNQLPVFPWEDVDLIMRTDDGRRYDLLVNRMRAKVTIPVQAGR